MRRIILLSLLLALLLPALAQRRANALTQEDIYCANFEDILQSVNETTDGVEKAYYYCMKDLDNDGVKELVMADINKLKTVFKVVDGEAHLISPDYYIDNDSLNWNLVENFYIFGGADLSDDATLREHPVFAYDIDIASNRFTVPGDVAWDESIMKSTPYNHMVFKPHVGDIHFVKAEKGSYDSDGTTIDLGLCYTYALNDASFTKKMFRGYSKDYAVPILVTDGWLDDHNPLQFSRWLYGEPEQRVTADAKNIILQYYGGQDRIRKIKWLASCPINERTFYEVLFEPRNGKVLLAFVCMAEGSVVSTKNMWLDQDKDSPNYADMGVEINDLIAFAPEIMVMAAAPAGLELYVRWPSLEGTHFDIWREVADQWMVISGDYHYIMAY